MPIVVYVQPDGTREEIDVPVGYSVMEGATMNGIAGIEAECGGACSCATCHSHIDPEWLPKLPPMDALEDAMLDSAKRVDAKLKRLLHVRVAMRVGCPF